MNYVENNQGVHADQVLKNVLIPERNAAYRLTLFLWNPTVDAGAGTITFLIQWSAPFGGVQTASQTLDLASGPAKVNIDQTIWSQAGTPIQYSVLGGGAYGAATYSYLLAMSDLSKPSHDEEDGECGPLIPVPLPIPGQSCCGRCRRNPCCCNQQQYSQQPNIIIVPTGSQPQYPLLPSPRRRQYLPYADEDDDSGYNGPWGCDNCP